MITGMPIHFGSIFMKSTSRQTSPFRYLDATLEEIKQDPTSIQPGDSLFIATQPNTSKLKTEVLFVCTDNLDKFVKEAHQIEAKTKGQTIQRDDFLQEVEKIKQDFGGSILPNTNTPLPFKFITASNFTIIPNGDRKRKSSSLTYTISTGSIYQRRSTLPTQQAALH